jgi:lipoate-protein ligase A
VKAPGVINVLDFTSRDAVFNMALDYHLFGLCESGAGDAFLRFYIWRPPALSLGYHEPARIVDEDAAREDGIEVVRRPTGGRVVLHKNDLTYAIVLPMNALPACGSARDGGGPHGATGIFMRISECIVEGLKPVSSGLRIDRGRARGGPEGARPCFASTSRYEITHGGRKVVGSAQRVGRRCVLQHGSIPVGADYLEIGRYLCGADRETLRAEVGRTTTCLEEMAGGAVNICEIVQSLRASFARGLNLRATDECADNYTGGVEALSERVRMGEYPVTGEDKIT